MQRKVEVSCNKEELEADEIMADFRKTIQEINVKFMRQKK